MDEISGVRVWRRKTKREKKKKKQKEKKETCIWMKRKKNKIMRKIK